MIECQHRKAVRLKIDLDTAKHIFNVDDKWDIIELLEKTKFSVAPTEAMFIDLELKTDTDLEGDWGRSRELYPTEFIKYLNIFREIIPETINITPENLRLVEYCFYDSCDAPDYFDQNTVRDTFYDEV